MIKFKCKIQFNLLGHEVVLLKNGCRICGSGGALASAPLVQSKSYFEVKLQQSGKWSIGLATRKTDLNSPRGGADAESWCLTSEHTVINNNKEIHRLAITEQVKRADSLDNLNAIVPGSSNETGLPGEGDTIGVTYDHVELNFYLNGKKLEIPVLNIRGNVYPALFGKYAIFRRMFSIFKCNFTNCLSLFLPSRRRSHFGHNFG